MTDDPGFAEYLDASILDRQQREWAERDARQVADACQQELNDHPDLERFTLSVASVRALIAEVPLDMPDTDRVSTEQDHQLAGTLSTIWPMSSRHPFDALHLAIYINDNFTRNA
jgi:hypothetical protein